METKAICEELDEDTQKKILEAQQTREIVIQELQKQNHGLM